MTVADDLATALKAVRGVFEMYGVNLTPVNMLEDEIDRLEGRIEVIREGMQRQQAATEARAEAAEAEIARLTDEQLVRYERGDDFHHDFWKSRAEAAEAEVARLRDGLLDACDVAIWLTGAIDLTDVPAWPEMREKLNAARALLAEDGAAKRVYPVSDWKRGTGDMVWCPGCAFGFGEDHVTQATGQYDCPVCHAQSRDGAA